MKKTLQLLFTIFFAIAGLVLLLYPHISFWLSNKNQSYVLQEYDNTISSIEKAQVEEALSKAALYNNQLNTTVIADPFASTDGSSDNAYWSLLNVQDSGLMGYVKIPRIQVTLPVYHGTDTATLQAGIGHMQGTSLPIGGHGTHSVLTGHTGLKTAKMFTDLERLSLGDEFYIYILDQVLAYRIDQVQVVDPDDIQSLVKEHDRDFVTLVTCTPYGINSHRLLVRGTRVPYTPEEINAHIADIVPALGRETILLLCGTGGIVLLLVIILLIPSYQKRKMRAATQDTAIAL